MINIFLRHCYSTNSFQTINYNLWQFIHMLKYYITLIAYPSETCKEYPVFLQSKKGLKYVGTSAPGPGVYSLPNTLRTQSDFNRSEVGRLFQKPIAQATELEKKEKRPAPNQYQVIKTLKCFVCMFVCVLEGVLLFISCYYFERT